MIKKKKSIEELMTLACNHETDKVETKLGDLYDGYLDGVEAEVDSFEQARDLLLILGAYANDLDMLIDKNFSPRAVGRALHYTDNNTILKLIYGGDYFATDGKK